MLFVLYDADVCMAAKDAKPSEHDSKSAVESCEHKQNEKQSSLTYVAYGGDQWRDSWSQWWGEREWTWSESQGWMLHDNRKHREWSRSASSNNHRSNDVVEAYPSTHPAVSWATVTANASDETVSVTSKNCDVVLVKRRRVQ